ncbi:amidohydrolase family protein [Plebeiibacterium marinum]|uniref:Amidohydrolase family protein n=1 Tax=Plebeiibacterium marinum TaxID=2992111 RepID=A0AAE3MDG6_9BACT|nr:amidohydrolase family protein [Plebeiobacterium marinum]MCW3805856.1 amidohydrolase family protein [Plebeiobacterium marinum]
MVIDSHHHFWKYNTAEFGWIDDRMSRIRRDFLPGDLLSEIKEAGVEGVVTVQARQSLLETDWLLEVAKAHDFIRGVVGWLPIQNGDFYKWLERYCCYQKLVGLRHVVQDEPDERFILGRNFNEGIKKITEAGLVYDILVFDKHLPCVIEFVKSHPNQLFVLDHIAKPKIREGYLSPWKENMKQLAALDNVYCKISGMVTEADFENWREEDLQPYFDVVLELFSPDRLLFGSDWPVCLVGIKYGRWVELVKKQVKRLSEDEQDAILKQNAIRVYGLYV